MHAANDASLLSAIVRILITDGFAILLLARVMAVGLWTPNREAVLFVGCDFRQFVQVFPDVGTRPTTVL